MKARSTRGLSWLCILALGALTAGCGHTIATGTATAGNSADFSLALSAPSLSVTAGGAAQSVSVSATALDGFTGAVQVTVSGAPAGVTPSPASFNLTPGAPQTVNFAAASSASAATATVQFAGAAGQLSHAASLALTVAAAAPPPPPTGTDVLTYHDDVGRTGLNAQETTLTLANVNSSQFGLLRILPVDGKVDAQPLYVSALTIGAQQHNVVYTATEHDSVYAFDADSGAQLWKTSILGSGENSSGDHGCSQISPEIGITSTPVIDRSAGAHGSIFVVGMSLDASGAYHQRLHALDITTGAELAGSPSEIRATYPGAGANSSGGNVVFDPAQYAERVGLLLQNGVLYIGWTSHCDEDPYTGWLMAYSESTLQQTAVLNLTPNGSEGSIWMAGAGLAADSSGNIYFLDANGSFDTTLTSGGFPTNGDYGNGFLKISTAGGKLAVADYFEMNNTVAESNADEDVGSGGALVLPDLTDSSGAVHHLAVGAGKDANIYVVNRDSMGKFNANNNTALYQEITGMLNNVFSMPAYFNNTVYYGSVSDALKAFPIVNAKLAAAPAYQSTNTFPYPGTTPAISANGTANGIVWAVENASPAVLHAYNAANLQELYNSDQAANSRDHFGNGNKFITPLVANGKVFVATPSGVAEFGLLP
ncbi:MAG: pyrrolo-quinoline quinone [Acidobacteriaceae bacterium]